MEKKIKHFYLALMGKIDVAWIYLFYTSFRKMVKRVPEEFFFFNFNYRGFFAYT